MKKSLARQKREYIRAVTAELVARYAMSVREAKKTIRKSPLKKALNLYPDVQLHYSIESAAKEVLDAVI